MKNMRYYLLFSLFFFLLTEISFSQQQRTSLNLKPSNIESTITDTNHVDTLSDYRMRVQSRSLVEKNDVEYPMTYSVNKQQVQYERTKEFVAYEITAVESKLAVVKGNEDLYRKYKKNGWVKATEERLKTLKEEFTNFDR